MYSNGRSYIMGLFIGEVERQLCFVDPKSSIVQIVDFDNNVMGHNYINGFKLIE